MSMKTCCRAGFPWVKRNDPFVEEGIFLDKLDWTPYCNGNGNSMMNKVALVCWHGNIELVAKDR